ncbi:MAG: B3/4 domain-containing protein [Candidatus Odinarchaeota archaeon]
MNSRTSIRFETSPSGTSIVVIELHNLNLNKSSKAFEEYEHSLFQQIRSNNELLDLGSEPLIKSYRALHWAFGIDPTKKRVSNEAVLRRVLQGENLWRISDLVDVVNLASAYHKIPIGLIDAAKISGQLVLRQARSGEVFVRIGGEELECRGRELVLADDIGIICYGFAIHDSDRTKVTKKSKQVILLLYGAPDATKEIMEEATNFTLNMVKQWVDCIASEPVRYVSPG